MRPCLALMCLALAGCGPTRVPFAADGEADLFAVIELTAQGELRASTGLLPFEESASAFTSGARAVALGWRADDLAALGAPGPEVLAAQPLEAATGCRPRLPAPTVTAPLGEVGEALVLPALGAPWLDAACPEVDPSDFAVDLTCKKFRCPLTVTRNGACTFDLDLDCEVGAVPATLWPDGTVCLEPPPALACTPQAPTPPRAASYACAEPEACRLDAYVGSSLGLEVDEVRLLDVPPYAPEPDLIGQLVLPPAASRYFGYAHDLAIAGDRVAVSVGAGAPFTGCRSDGAASGRIVLYDAETLARTASAAVAGCLPRLASGPNGLLALRDTFASFELVRLSTEGRVIDARPADPRVTAPAGEAPLLHTADARPTYFDVVGDYLVAAVVTATPPGTKVFTWDAATLEPARRLWLPQTTLVAGARVDDRTIVLAATARSGYVELRLDTGRVQGPVPLPPDLVRDDNVTSDIAWAPAAGRALLLLSRKNASLLGMDSTGVRSRAVVFDGDTRPMAARLFPARRLALVAGAWSTDQTSWPASLHLYDLETNRFRPGAVSVGHGAPGRIVPDARGRLWVLLPWDATLLRVSLP